MQSLRGIFPGVSESPTSDPWKRLSKWPQQRTMKVWGKRFGLSLLKSCSWPDEDTARFVFILLLVKWPEIVTSFHPLTWLCWQDLDQHCRISWKMYFGVQSRQNCTWIVVVEVVSFHARAVETVRTIEGTLRGMLTQKRLICHGTIKVQWKGTAKTTHRKLVFKFCREDSKRFFGKSYHRKILFLPPQTDLHVSTPEDHKYDVHRNALPWGKQISLWSNGRVLLVALKYVLVFVRVRVYRCWRLLAVSHCERNQGLEQEVGARWFRDSDPFSTKLKSEILCASFHLELRDGELFWAPRPFPHSGAKETLFRLKRDLCKTFDSGSGLSTTGLGDGKKPSMVDESAWISADPYLGHEQSASSGSGTADGGFSRTQSDTIEHIDSPWLLGGSFFGGHQTGSTAWNFVNIWKHIWITSNFKSLQLHLVRLLKALSPRSHSVTSCRLEGYICSSKKPLGIVNLLKKHARELEGSGELNQAYHSCSPRHTVMVLADFRLNPSQSSDIFRGQSWLRSESAEIRDSCSLAEPGRLDKQYRPWNCAFDTFMWHLRLRRLFWEGLSIEHFDSASSCWVEWILSGRQNLQPAAWNICVHCKFWRTFVSWWRSQERLEPFPLWFPTDGIFNLH